MLGQYQTATKRLTASGEVSAAGVNTRIFSVHALSGATAGASTFKTGGTSGTLLLSLTCPTISATNSFIWPSGIQFVNGAFWTKDANTTEITVTYATETT